MLYVTQSIVRTSLGLVAEYRNCWMTLNLLKPNTHRLRDSTVELRRVGVGGV